MFSSNQTLEVIAAEKKNFLAICIQCINSQINFKNALSQSRFQSIEEYQKYLDTLPVWMHLSTEGDNTYRLYNTLNYQEIISWVNGQIYINDIPQFFVNPSQLATINNVDTSTLNNEETTETANNVNEDEEEASGDSSSEEQILCANSNEEPKLTQVEENQNNHDNFSAINMIDSPKDTNEGEEKNNDLLPDGFEEIFIPASLPETGNATLQSSSLPEISATREINATQEVSAQSLQSSPHTDLNPEVDSNISSLSNTTNVTNINQDQNVIPSNVTPPSTDINLVAEEVAHIAPTVNNEEQSYYYYNQNTKSYELVKDKDSIIHRENEKYYTYMKMEVFPEGKLPSHEIQPSDTELVLKEPQDELIMDSIDHALTRKQEANISPVNLTADEQVKQKIINEINYFEEVCSKCKDSADKSSFSKQVEQYKIRVTKINEEINKNNKVSVKKINEEINKKNKHIYLPIELVLKVKRESKIKKEKLYSFELRLVERISEHQEISTKLIKWDEAEQKMEKYAKNFILFSLQKSQQDSIIISPANINPLNQADFQAGSVSNEKPNTSLLTNVLPLNEVSNTLESNVEENNEKESNAAENNAVENSTVENNESIASQELVEIPSVQTNTQINSQGTTENEMTNNHEVSPVVTDINTEIQMPAYSLNEDVTISINPSSQTDVQCISVSTEAVNEQASPQSLTNGVTINEESKESLSDFSNNLHLLMNQGKSMII